MAIDLSEFEIQNKASWEKAALKALKGKPLNELEWPVDDVIKLQPFYTSESRKPVQTELPHPKESNDWYIGESFDGTDPYNANEQLLKALAFGLDSPLFMDLDDYTLCLDQVKLDFLFPIFRTSNLDKFLIWANNSDLDLRALEGAFIVYEAGFDTIDIAESVSQIRNVSNTFPKFYTAHITFAIDPENLGRSIGGYLLQLSDLIHQLQSNSLPVKIICEIECDNDFLKNVAILRALRLMFAQICDAYKIPANAILIDTYIYQHAQDVQLAMISASCQAVATVSAGTDRLTISCEAFDVQEDEEVSRRMTRNVHHLMKMESDLNKTIDPLAGSYTLEVFTNRIANESWEVFQQG